MKLLGAEISNFACFDRQYVPIREGISVLVGKNNAGKTAILRGLGALASIPMGLGPKKSLGRLEGYLRNGASRSFDIELLCQIDTSDAEYLRNFPQLEEAYKTGLAKWRCVVSGDGIGTLLNCTLHLPGNNVVNFVTIQAAVGFVSNFRQPDFVVTSQQQVNWDHKVFAPLTNLAHVRLVSPHRVVQDVQTLQTATELPSDARNLAQYLQTLYGQDRDTFHSIEKFVTEVFPEFKYVNPASGENNQVSIVLVEAQTGRNIPLSNCGTGVEQILTLATFVLTTPEPGLILLDEPHSYLHPTAERALVEFLHKHSKHRYLISTHSAVLMNSVDAERIIHISPPGQPYKPTADHTETSRILFDLGYKNSDSLFHDRLVVVEGKSDSGILPILLLADGVIAPSELNRTGFPNLGGVGKGSTAVQTSIHRYEKLLDTVGRANQPRVYVLDGDRRDDDRGVLKGTRNPGSNELLKVEFLPRLEIENYLLVAQAICLAVREELTLAGRDANIENAQIEAALQPLLASDEERLFPQGKVAGRRVEEQVKGSLVLERLYDNFGLRYNKERSGMLIARHISTQNQPAIEELTKLVKPIF
jgi:energy-coupling factor transporter ATP-binding protein EcfA2